MEDGTGMTAAGTVDDGANSRRGQSVDIDTVSHSQSMRQPTSKVTRYIFPIAQTPK
jgi:hypothetical protein